MAAKVSTVGKYAFVFWFFLRITFIYILLHALFFPYESNRRRDISSTESQRSLPGLDSEVSSPLASHLRNFYAKSREILCFQLEPIYSCLSSFSPYISLIISLPSYLYFFYLFTNVLTFLFNNYLSASSPICTRSNKILIFEYEKEIETNKEKYEDEKIMRTNSNTIIQTSSEENENFNESDEITRGIMNLEETKYKLERHQNEANGSSRIVELDYVQVNRYLYSNLERRDKL